MYMYSILEHYWKLSCLSAGCRQGSSAAAATDGRRLTTEKTGLLFGDDVL